MRKCILRTVWFRVSRGHGFTGNSRVQFFNISWIKYLDITSENFWSQKCCCTHSEEKVKKWQITLMFGKCFLSHPVDLYSFLPPGEGCSLKAAKFSVSKISLIADLNLNGRRVLYCDTLCIHIQWMSLQDVNYGVFQK